MKLSVIIITRNEQANIGACLASVDFADEIIVLDSGSTDQTCDIARKAGARVEVTADWPGFGAQKNRALALASGEWVLSIDADEQVSPALKQAIRQALDAPRADCYRVSRLSNFCGRWIRHSGWWPDRIVRVFRRAGARFSDDAVHEKVIVQGTVGDLSGELLHYPYASLEAFIDKINRYSTAAAHSAFLTGRRTTVLGPFGHATWTFLRHYVLRRGFLDGWQGLVLAGMAATGSFYRYAKLYWLWRRPS